MKKVLVIAAILLVATSLSFAQTSATGTATLAVTVGTEAAIVVNSSPAFGSIGIFGNYTSTTDLTYFVRTGTSVTTAGITVQVTTDFSTGGANGGPSVKTPPDPADLLTYSCTVAAPAVGLATACSGPVTAVWGSATNVVTFGANTQSLKAGNDVKTAWTLVNDPNYKAGTYDAVATYTISAS